MSNSIDSETTTTEDAEDAEGKILQITGFFLLSSVSSVVGKSFLGHAPKGRCVLPTSFRYRFSPRSW